MIDNIAYFPLQTARNSAPVIESVLESVRRRGIRCDVNSLDSAAVILWSVLWSGKMSANQAVYRHYRDRQRPVIVIDVGALRRGVTWKIALNNVNAQGYYGHQNNIDPGRADRLGVRLEAVQPGRAEIIIAGQHERSLQVQHIDVQAWTQHMIDQLQKYTDRPIIFRPHPRSRIRYDLRGCTVQAPQHIAGTYDDFDMCWNYHAVINYSSGPGIQAGIHGARLIVSDHSLARPVSNTVEEIESAPVVDREQWFREICHTEYTLDEIAQGVWIDRLEEGLC